VATKISQTNFSHGVHIMPSDHVRVQLYVAVNANAMLGETGSKVRKYDFRLFSETGRNCAIFADGYLTRDKNQVGCGWDNGRVGVVAGRGVYLGWIHKSDHGVCFRLFRLECQERRDVLPNVRAEPTAEAGAVSPD
jgi:hypothetical protein